MSIHQQFIQILIETGDKLSLVDFFKDIPGAKRRRRRRLKDFIL
jgi:hypothetical protein